MHLRVLPLLLVIGCGSERDVQTPPEPDAGALPADAALDVAPPSTPDEASTDAPTTDVVPLPDEAAALDDGAAPMFLNLIRCDTDAGMFECVGQLDGGLLVLPNASASVEVYATPGGPPVTCAAGMPPAVTCAFGTACAGLLRDGDASTRYDGVCR